MELLDCTAFLDANKLAVSKNENNIVKIMTWTTFFDMINSSLKMVIN